MILCRFFTTNRIDGGNDDDFDADQVGDPDGDFDGDEFVVLDGLHLAFMRV